MLRFLTVCVLALMLAGCGGQTSCKDGKCPADMSCCCKDACKCCSACPSKAKDASKCECKDCKCCCACPGKAK